MPSCFMEVYHGNSAENRYLKTCGGLTDHSICHSVCSTEHESRWDFVYSLFRQDSSVAFNIGIIRPWGFGGDYLTETKEQPKRISRARLPKDMFDVSKRDGLV